MKLEDIAYALRTTSEIARAGERLFDSLATSRRARVWPLLLGVGAGIGIGALLFDDSLRERMKNWLSEREVVREREPAQPAVQPVAH